MAGGAVGAGSRASLLLRGIGWGCRSDLGRDPGAEFAVGDSWASYRSIRPARRSPTRRWWNVRCGLSCGRLSRRRRGGGVYRLGQLWDRCAESRVQSGRCRKGCGGAERRRERAIPVGGPLCGATGLAGSGEVAARSAPPTGNTADAWRRRGVGLPQGIHPAAPMEDPPGEATVPVGGPLCGATGHCRLRGGRGAERGVYGVSLCSKNAWSGLEPTHSGASKRLPLGRASPRSQ